MVQVAKPSTSRLSWVTSSDLLKIAPPTICRRNLDVKRNGHWNSIFCFPFLFVFSSQKSDKKSLIFWGVTVRVYPRSSTKCVVALTPDDKADQRVPRDKSGAQAPKIVLAPSRQYPSSDSLCCRGILGLSPSVCRIMLLVSVCRTIWINLKYTVNEPPCSLL